MKSRRQTESAIPADAIVGNVPTVEFSRKKYGPELLIDVAWIRDMPSFIKTDDPYRLDFYDITLISRGNGVFWLDNKRYSIESDTVLFTSPGQARRWIVNDLDGLCLFFPAVFLLEHFNDPLFLHRLHYFHTDDGPDALCLAPGQRARLLERLDSMHQEIRDLQSDSPHLLRAIAYEVLIKLNRWYAERYGQQLEDSSGHAIARFRRLVERDFKNTHSVSDYARLLGLTPGHLTYLCQKHLGRSAGDIIRGRVLAEARRLLVHTEYDVGQISLHLGYGDPSYFSRVFKRAARLSPLAYRRMGQRELGL